MTQPPTIQPMIRQFTASDGCPLHFRHWRAVQVKGLIVAAHGIQSHSGWYEYSSSRLAAAGYEVYFADRRGSGLNPDRRGHADHGLRLINDLRQLIRLARREHPRTEGQACPPALTLLGLSWGGKTAAAAAAVAPHDVDRLVLLYPGLIPRRQATPWQSLRLWLSRELELRHRNVEIPLKDPALFTGSREWQDRIASDPLSLHEVTTGLLNAGRDLDQLIRRHRNSLQQPALLLLAGQDQIIDNARTRALAASFGCCHLTMIVYPQARHTLEFESNRDRHIDDLIDWLNSRCHGSARSA